MPGRNDRNAAWDDDDATLAESWQPLRPDQLPAPSVGPGQVVLAQAVAGCGTALLAWALSGRLAVMYSALYGAAAVVLPAAVMARGLVRPAPQSAPALGAVRLMVWEGVKLMLAVAMLVLAPRTVADLSWPALLIGMVVCLKVYWLALLWRRR